MSEVVIRAENISKQYRLGSIGTGSLRRDMQGWLNKNILKKKIPDHQLNTKDAFEDWMLEGEFENINFAPSNDILWALKNVNFEIKKGEAWGIIGKNGSGKSTFLKILSRIIKPTTGIVKGNGRVSSLLEVGTGFHSELSGRENIYISGFMLGMKKAEIQAKFDEIVAFSGIERFLDTPVKRYSSGMYVRLAFSVAAHLEPDILILDEVLSVGDADFQKKSIAKMNESIKKEGRTVIFVSHNLSSVSSICSKAFWLESGVVKLSGDSTSIVHAYLKNLQDYQWKQEFSSMENAPGSNSIKVLYIELCPQLANPLDKIDTRTPLTVKFRFYNYLDQIKLSVGLLLFTISGECIFDIKSPQAVTARGMIKGECNIPGNFLNDGSYYFTLYFVKDTSEGLFSYDECLSFSVDDDLESNVWSAKWWGYVRPAFPLTLSPVTTPDKAGSIILP